MNALFALDNGNHNCVVLVSGIEKLADIVELIAPVDREFYSNMGGSLELYGRTSYWTPNVTSALIDDLDLLDSGAVDMVLTRRDDAPIAAVPDEIAAELVCHEFEVDQLSEAGVSVVFFFDDPYEDDDRLICSVPMETLLRYREYGKGVPHD